MGQSRQGVMLTTDLHLAPRLRMSGVYLHSASVPPLLGRGQLHVLSTVDVFACLF